MVWKIIGAAGSIAAIISLVITYPKFCKRMKISAKMEMLENYPFVIRIHNTSVVENGIKDIAFYKGKPGKLTSICLYAQQIIENGRYFVMPKESLRELYYEPRVIVNQTWIDHDKAFGKTTDKIYISITDINGKVYTINTRKTCGFIEVIAERTTDHLDRR